MVPLRLRAGHRQVLGKGCYLSKQVTNANQFEIPVSFKQAITFMQIHAQVRKFNQKYA